MKKFFISILILISTILLVNNQVFAEDPPPQSINYTNYVNQFTEWEGFFTDGVFHVRSNAVLIQHDYLEIEINTGTECLISSPQWICDLDYAFREHAFSKVTIHNNSSPNTMANETYMLKYEAPEALEILFMHDGTNIVTEIEHKFKHVRIHLAIVAVLNVNESQTILNRLNLSLEDYFPGISIRAFNDTSPVENTIDSLPFTTGNPFEEGGHFGEVDFAYFANTFTMNLDYFGNYQLELSGLVFSSEDFLENVVEAFYYTIDNERFIVFYYQENMDVLLSDIDILTKQWSGFAIWNMTTGEVITTNRAWVLTYLYKDPADANMDIYAYFYMPQIPVDDLLSVSLVMNYRYYYHSFPFEWGAQKVEEVWSNTSMVLQKDAQMLGAYPTWVKEVWIGSAAAFAAGTILSIIPGTQPVGIALVLTGGILMNIANIGAINYLITGGIDEIVHVANPSQTLKGNIQTHYSELAGAPITIDPGDPLYRLYLGRYNKTGVSFYANDVEICYDHENQACDEWQEFKYTEIVWTTEGEIYSITEPYIDAQTTMDQSWFISLPEPTPTLASRLSAVIRAGSIAGFTIIWALVAFKGGGFDKLWKFIVFAIGYIGLLAAILYAFSSF